VVHTVVIFDHAPLRVLLHEDSINKICTIHKPKENSTDTYFIVRTLDIDFQRNLTIRRI